MRVILLTHGGAELVLAELSKLKNVEIVGVFIETAITPPRPFKEKIKRSIRYDGYFETAKKLFAKVLNTKITGAEEEKIVASSCELTEETATKPQLFRPTERKSLSNLAKERIRKFI